MKRSEILSRLGYSVPNGAKVRVIVDTDAKNEADDQFAIVHFLLSPSMDVRAVTAAHFEGKARDGESMNRSFQEIKRLLTLMEIDDMPALRGQRSPTDSELSDAALFIIDEARRDDPRPLYVAVLGAATNLAAALRAAPEIGERITAVWNGGGPYPKGRPEFNVAQDPDAARTLLSSSAQVWQIPQDVFAAFEVTLAELFSKIRPYGRIGEYLARQLEEDNLREFNPHFLLRTGENWTLGDNATVAALLMSRFRGNFHTRPAPVIAEELTYIDHPGGKEIRVYDSMDVRMTLEDLFAKLALAYGRNYEEESL